MPQIYNDNIGEVLRSVNGDIQPNTAVTPNAANAYPPGLPANSVQYNNNGVFSGIPFAIYENNTLNLGNVSNIKITGGYDQQFLTTDGTGNIAWSNVNVVLPNAVPFIHFDVTVDGTNQQFINDNLTEYPYVGNVNVAKDGAILEPGTHYAITGNRLIVFPFLHSGSDIDVLARGAGGGGNGGGSGGYSNANVITFLPTYTGNMTFTVANLRISNGNSGQTLQTDGINNLSWVTPYSNSNAISFLPNYNGAMTFDLANFRVRQGSPGQLLINNGNNQFAWIDNYSNTNVEQFLPTYEGNMTFSNITLNVTGGSNGQTLITDGTGNLRWVDIGNGVPGGVNTQIQFNNQGQFGGVQGLNYRDATVSFDQNVRTTFTNTYVQYSNSTVQLGNVSDVYIYGGQGYGAVLAQPTVYANGAIAIVQILQGGRGYTVPPLVTFTGSNTVTAVAYGVLGLAGDIIGLDFVTRGLGYTLGEASANIAGPSTKFLATDTTGSLRWQEINFANNAGRGAQVAGNIGEIQYNLGNVLGAVPTFTFDLANSNLNITGNISLGNVSNVKLDGGVNSYVLQTDGTGNLTWTQQIGGSGNGIPGGANTQIQYNNASGNFAGIVGFTYDNTVDALTIGVGNTTISNISNLHIPGGTRNQAIVTDGNGNLRWGAAATTSWDGVANISVGDLFVGILGITARPGYPYTSDASPINSTSWFNSPIANLWGNVSVVKYDTANTRWLAVFDTNDSSLSTTRRELLATSSDGVEWFANDDLPQSNANADYHTLELRAGNWLALSNTYGIYTSTDLFTWTHTIDRPIQSAAQSANVIIATAIANGANSNSTLSSPDGLTWTTSAAPAAFSFLQYGNSVWVGAGNDGRIYYSTQNTPTTWTQVSGIQSSFSGLAYGNGIFVALGTSSTSWRSTDGINWTDITSYLPFFFTARIRYVNTKFLLTETTSTGAGSDYSIWSSSDGLTWLPEIDAETQLAVNFQQPYLPADSGNGRIIIGGFTSTAVQFTDNRIRVEPTEEAAPIGIYQCLGAVNATQPIYLWTRTN